ncbi:MAG: DUF3445 domain-containing protein [Candidatus Hydrogenedentes bacterium]|nr:DUF3445 domain-containing protein [Candidatus Hydrogenedentota bacterium]
MTSADELVSSLAQPAWYTPYAKGVYSVGPGLKRFGHDFGNGPADQRVFQLDRDFVRYHDNKRAAQGDLADYFGTCNFTAEMARAVGAFLLCRLTTEYPALFAREGDALHCRLTGDTVATNPHPEDFRPTLKLLGMQVQEDFCLMSLGPGQSWTSLVHVMAPNYWRPGNILGASYERVHDPVPGMDRLKSKASRMLDSIAAGAQYIRFVWGLETDDRLNHHPDLAGNSDRARAWYLAPPEARRLFVRIERQVLIGLPEVNSLYFGIRTYIRDVDELPVGDRLALAQAVRGMSEAERSYKGLTGCAKDFIHYLSANQPGVEGEP